jgi:hypothetical protein
MAKTVLMFAGPMYLSGDVNGLQLKIVPGNGGALISRYWSRAYQDDMRDLEALHVAIGQFLEGKENVP